MSQPAELHALFLQLQARYPTSSLITEFIQVQQGQFLVRAVVQLHGVAIASGMAAAATVEQAEDQARLRVLSWLGINAAVDNVPLAQPVPASTPTFPTNGFTSLPSVAPPTWLEQELVVADIPTQPDVPAPLIQLDSIQAFESDEVPDYLVDDSESSDGAAEAGVEEAGAEAAIAPDNEPPPEVTSPESDDLSSLIALTDIEMDRIGWTKQEGREYLKRTYKKSTRQRLDVDELMDFLNYLRALPSLNGL
jgi:hypothetical protein